MKILPNGQIQVEQGDTLYSIYGPNWKQQSGYIGDPTKLQVGTILPAPSAGTQSYSDTPIVTSETDRINAEIAKLRQQIEEATGKVERAKKYIELYPGATSTSEIPDWVLNAKSPEDVAAQILPERIKELEKTAFQPPAKTIQDLWDEAYKKSKLPDLEAKIAKTKNDLYSAEGKINENPWYSEAGRVGQIRKLYDIAQKDIDNLTEQYNAELDKVKFQVESAQKQQEAITTAQQKELEYLIKKQIPKSQWPESSPETYKEWILAGGEKGTGMSYVNYVASKSKQTASPTTIGSSSTGYYQYDAKTGTWKQIIAPASTTETPENISEVLGNYTLVDELLRRNLSLVTGPLSFATSLIPGETQYTKNLLAQVKNILSVNNRTKLKGSGAISDFESKMLASASSAIGTNLSPSDLRKELIKIKGVFANAAGMASFVKVTDPVSGQFKTGLLKREDINDAIRQGFIVEYIE